MISILPLELFDLVNQHLCTQDKYRCLFVCQSWYSVFRLALYQNCILASPQAYRSFYATLKNGQDQGYSLGGQVRVLDTSHCELSMQDLKSLFQLCPNVRGSKFRWLDSFLEMDGFENHDLRLFTQAQITDCQHQHMWDHQPSFPVRPAIDTNSADHHRLHQQQSQLPPNLPRSLSLCDSLTQLTLHGADMVGLFTVVTHLSSLEQLYLISTKLDMAISDLERLHTACPHLSSLSIELHSLSSLSSQPTDRSIGAPIPQMRHLKLVYKKLEKPGRSPWIQYLAHKYPSLTSLEMKTRFVQRQHYWRWNNSIDDDDHGRQQLQQQDDWENMECHPEFRYALKQWAKSCRHLTRIHFTGIPWDQWFLKHLPLPIKKTTNGDDDYYRQQQQQPLFSSSTIGHRVQHIHVVRMDDNFNAAAATFSTLINHTALKQLSRLTFPPISPLPDDSFYKALGQLDSLASLTIHQQGVRSNKLSPCQLDIHQILFHCRNLDTLDLGGIALSTLDQHQQQLQPQQQLHLRSLTLSTTNISHSTLQRVLHTCPSLNRFYFISCEYEASLEYGIPTLAIEHPGIQWKEVHIRYPLIQSPHMEQYHQPMGLSGSRRRGGTPRYLTISQQQQQQPNDQWIYLDANQQESQRKLDALDITTIIDDQQHQKNLAMRKPGLELGRIKINCRSIGFLYINGTRIHL